MEDEISDITVAYKSYPRVRDLDKTKYNKCEACGGALDKQGRGSG